MENPRVIDLGRMGYISALAEQRRHLEEVIAARAEGGQDGGRILVVEHEPVITISRRSGAGMHLLATPERLASAGVELCETDRGGDVTYHGPGQLVVYPILDLNDLNLGIHDYMRLLEEAVIAACATFGVRTCRDPGATGVWIERDGRPRSKVAAMGVRVRRWVSMHGLSLNVDPDMSHFGLIVPCGLHGREVTSLRRELGPQAPGMAAAKVAVVRELSALIAGARTRGAQARTRVSPGRHSSIG